MLLTQLAGYFYNLFSGFSKPQTYGSALEEYIVRHSPQNTQDIDRLTRQFDLKQSGRSW